MDLLWQFAHWQQRQMDGTAPPIAAELKEPLPLVAQAEGGQAFLLRATWIIDRLTRVVALYCGGILLFVLMASIIVDVTGRYVFNHPLYGSLDMAITLLVLIVASSIAYGGRTGAHVTADIFSTLVSSFVERLTGIFVKFFAAAIVAIWCWRLFVSGRLAARLGETTLLLNIPFEPIYHALSFGIGLYALVLVLEGLMLVVRGDAPLLVDESRIVPSAIAPVPAEQPR
jgi:TRAP-type transport system small permease protein